MAATYSFDSVVNYFGRTQSRVARQRSVPKQVVMAKRLKVSPQAVFQWKQANGFPKLRTYQIEVLSRGRFRHYRLPICADSASAKSSSSRRASTN